MLQGVVDVSISIRLAVIQHLPCAKTVVIIGTPTGLQQVRYVKVN